MRRRFAGVAVCALLWGIAPLTAAGASASVRGTSIIAVTPTTSAPDASPIAVIPSSIGTPGATAGTCVLTFGQAFHPGDVWTCYVALFSNSTAPVPWSGIGPTFCGGPAWECKTRFSPSSGTVGPDGVWVKITTAIGNCAGYTLSFKSSRGTVYVPVQCSGTSLPPQLVVFPSNIGLLGDADGPCLLTFGEAFQKGDVWTCYVALFSNSDAPVQWTAIGPTSCGGPAWECKTTFSPSSGTAGVSGVWVQIMTAIGGCANYSLSFKSAQGTLHVPVNCG